MRTHSTFLASSLLSLSALFAQTGQAQTVQITYPEGIKRQINCQEAFYRFADDPERKLWMTCDGYEAADKPLAGDKAFKEDPKNRDWICDVTDAFDPNNPVSLNDPQAGDIQGDFSDAAVLAFIHASTMHESSINTALILRASLGTDVFEIYNFAIRRPNAGETPFQIMRNGVLENALIVRTLLDEKGKVIRGSDNKPKVIKEPFVYQPGWQEKSKYSAYVEATKLCTPVLNNASP